MQTFKSVLFFIFALIVCEGIAIGASAWSFLESSLASFNQLKISSDHRARDTVSSLSKSTESKLEGDKLADLNFTFARLVKVTSEDKDGFRIKEISIVNDSGVVLASSNEDYVEDPLKKRKPEIKFLSPTFTIAHRLRKWQVGTPVLLGKRNVPSDQPVLKAVAPIFPEILEPEVLLSMGVYHPEKLERVASLFMTYERGNFGQFVSTQTDLFLWIAQNNAWIALICALILGLMHILIKSAGSSAFAQANTSAPSAARTVSSPPLWEKVDFAQTEGPVRWQAGSQPTASQQSLSSTPMPAAEVQRHVPAKTDILEKPMPISSPEIVAQRLDKPEILDAIYLG
ncbi:hypothetical protein LEP1GSC058_0734 [Leptospira fainei serovar Hurstbridge str. BUT 6]|uniref:Uncharacterized protein n=1 Tax=Leptospira fainei serovar Hurstbridge str. BUT 6 TaxID=1193011 RepID=S3V5E6_9LEPT|nr:hypothetical protein [Leptospira fainei]EPG75859.1 hypothetical protein LEP1GSC058_0734 [Leptospira fainei serovar Hurstbridge str. BUT 6]